jgi:uracil-DNA glycosylase
MNGISRRRSCLLGRQTGSVRLILCGGVPISTLAQLRSAEAGCTRCPLYQFATHVVPGEGAAHARLMLVGEQPGDSEDLSGRPFVGPAGKILDRALREAQIARRDVYVTNAVKHFKYEMRGKRRLHKRPNTEEIDQCKWWLEQELQLVRPRVVIALGATAARSLLGKVVTISSMRGVNQRLADGQIAVVTIHPAYLLRLRDAADKDREYRAFVCDLRRGKKLCA